MTIHSHTISATEASRSMSNLLNKVHYQGAHFKIKRGNLVIAEIIPVVPQKYCLMVSELNALFARAPALDKGDAKLFEEDIQKIRAQMKPDVDSWD